MTQYAYIFPCALVDHTQTREDPLRDYSQQLGGKRVRFGFVEELTKPVLELNILVNAYLQNGVEAVTENVVCDAGANC